jgi:two-component system, OmpR family, phosphate regulon sensor histidine kinase PhoR
VDGLLPIVLALGLAVVAATWIAERRGRTIRQLERAATERSRDGRVPERPSNEVGVALDDLADLSGVGFVRFDDDLRVRGANATAHAALGREPGSMLGRTAIEALADHRIEAIARRAQDDGAAAGEVLVHGDEGAAFNVRARRAPTAGVWLVIEDVAELRRLRRIRAEFIDNLSHELRTPITTVGLLTATLARDAEAAGDQVPSKMRERIGKLEVETGNIAQMVSELLDLARIESGTRELQLEEVDLGRIAAESTERLRPFAERQGVTLKSTVEAGLPAVRGDSARLGQVFANLIHNAVKFSDGGTTVTVDVRRDGEDIAASIEDHGIGISPADQSRVFERFFKADRTRSTGGGTGLGLSIARHVLEGHGGEIRVESIEGEGSTFTFRIPIPAATPVGSAPGAGRE